MAQCSRRPSARPRYAQPRYAPRWMAAAAHGAFAAALGVALAAPRGAEAPPETRLVPSTEGHLGAWLAVGPLSGRGVEALRARGIAGDPGRSLAQLGARSVSSPHAGIDLARELSLGRGAGPRALVLTDLELAEDIDAWLLVSADGDVRAELDGVTVLVRETGGLRDRSFHPVRVTLSSGRHRLALWLHHPGEHWAYAARLLDARDLLPPAGLQVIVGGVDEAARLRERLAEPTLLLEPSRVGFRPRLRVEFPRGMPLESPPLELLLRGADTRSFRLGRVPSGTRGVGPFVVDLPEIPVADGAGRKALELRAELRFSGSRTLARPILQAHVLADARGPAWIRRADALLERLEPSAPPVLATSLRFHQANLARSSRSPEASPAALLSAGDRFAELLERIEQALAQGAPAKALELSGIHDLAIASKVDGRPEEVLVHVPENYSRTAPTRYPLTVLLHGYKGTPQGILQAFLDSESWSAHPRVAGFVIAPNAHGNAFYRGPGETAVLEAIQWALKAYAIDPLKVAISGVSMGGTGAAQIAFRHPDLFAAAAPLAGYHSYFVRRDIHGRSLRDWERRLMHHWSPVSWAENGEYLPLYVAHGTKDKPLENSRVLTRRYRELGFRLVEDWPDTGHAVWKRTYAGARLHAWLTSFERPAAPKSLRIVTDALRYAKRHWLTLLELAEPGALARATVALEGDSAVRATTEGVRAFHVERPALGSGNVDATVDGQTLEFAAGEPLDFCKHVPPADGATWQKGRACLTSARGPIPPKRAGLEGPIHDAFLGPLVFVYGTGNPATARANRELARSFATPRYHADVAYPVVADVDFDRRAHAGSSWFLVGTKDDNFVLATIDAALPMRARADGIELGHQRLQGENLGALFIYPNPSSAEGYVIVLTAPSPAGLWQALALPELLPDYVVFDSHVAAAAGQKVLGAASVREAGFFGSAWQLAERPPG